MEVPQRGKERRSFMARLEAQPAFRLLGHLDSPTIKSVRLGEANVFAGWVFRSVGVGVTQPERLWYQDILVSRK